MEKKNISKKRTGEHLDSTPPHGVHVEHMNSLDSNALGNSMRFFKVLHKLLAKLFSYLPFRPCKFFDTFKRYFRRAKQTALHSKFTRLRSSVHVELPKIRFLYAIGTDFFLNTPALTDKIR